MVKDYATTGKDKKSRSHKDAKLFMSSIIILLCISIILSGIVSFGVISTVLNNKAFSWLDRKNITDMDINNLIKDCFAKGRMQVVYDFYANYIGDYELAYILVNGAIENDVPINKLIALVECESQFKPSIKKLNGNATYDYGLMQLNSATYSSVIKNKGEAYILDPSVNVGIGIQHLLECYKLTKDWNVSLVIYNAGPGVFNKQVPWSSVKHMSNIIDAEKKLDMLFNSNF